MSHSLHPPNTHGWIILRLIVNCILSVSSYPLISYPSSVLTYIFMIDVNLPYTQPTTSPRISDFTERILLQLKPLTEGDEEIQNHVIEENEVGEQDERTQAIKLLKTGGLALHFLSLTLVILRMVETIGGSFYSFNKQIPVFKCLQCWSGWLQVLAAPSPLLSQNSCGYFPCSSRWNILYW